GRMHPPGPEGVHGPGPGGQLAARCRGGDPRRLAEQAKERGLQQAEVEVGAGQSHHGLLGVEHVALVDRLDLDAAAGLGPPPVQQPQGLLESPQYGPSPAAGKGARPDLRDHRGVLVLGLEDVLSSEAVDVGYPPRADVGGRGHVQPGHALSSSTNEANSAARAAAESGPPDSAHTRTSGSWGCGTTSTQSSPRYALTPSIVTTGRSPLRSPKRSISRRITVPLLSQGVSTSRSAMCARGSSSRTALSDVSARARSSSNLTSAMSASWAARNSGNTYPPASSPPKSTPGRSAAAVKPAAEIGVQITSPLRRRTISSATRVVETGNTTRGLLLVPATSHT